MEVDGEFGRVQMTIPYQHTAEGVPTPIDRIRKRVAGCGVLMLERQAATSTIQPIRPRGGPVHA